MLWLILAAPRCGFWRALVARRRKFILSFIADIYKSIPSIRHPGSAEAECAIPELSTISLPVDRSGIGRRSPAVIAAYLCARFAVLFSFCVIPSEAEQGRKKRSAQSARRYSRALYCLRNASCFPGAEVRHISTPKWSAACIFYKIVTLCHPLSP